MNTLPEYQTKIVAANEAYLAAGKYDPGGDGDDTALYWGVQEDYTVTKNEGYTTVKDKRVNQDQDGWTLPYQMGVKVVAVNTPLDIEMMHIETAAPDKGAVSGRAASAYLLPPATNNSFIAVNRILKNGGEVTRIQEQFDSNGTTFLPGTWAVRSGSVSASFMNALADELNITVMGSSRNVSGNAVIIRQPRIALYKSWRANIDEGWTRWILEQFEFPYTNIFDADIRAGGLNGRFDVIIIPSMSTNELINGHKKGAVPPQYSGGISDAGTNNIIDFIEQGGTLVALNGSTLFALDKMDLPVTNAIQDLSNSIDGEAPQFAIPGSIVRMKYHNEHPVAYGMPEEAPAFLKNSPAFQVMERGDNEAVPRIIAEYPDNDLLMSGYQVGESYLYNMASAVEVPYGSGTLILLGFGVQSRAQPHGTFKLLFNALFFTGDN